MIQFLLDGTNLINPAVCIWVGCANWEHKYCGKLLCTLLILGVELFQYKLYFLVVRD